MATNWVTESREYRYDLCSSNYDCCAQQPEDRTSDLTRA